MTSRFELSERQKILCSPYWRRDRKVLALPMGNIIQPTRYLRLDTLSRGAILVKAHHHIIGGAEDHWLCEFRDRQIFPTDHWNRKAHRVQMRKYLHRYFYNWKGR